MQGGGVRLMAEWGKVGLWTVMGPPPLRPVREARERRLYTAEYTAGQYSGGVHYLVVYNPLG